MQIRKKLAIQRKHLDELDEHVQEMEKEKSGNHNKLLVPASVGDGLSHNRIR